MRNETKTEGSSLSLNDLVEKIFSDGVALMCCNVLSNNGPATIIVGMPMINPYNKVFPIFALNNDDNATGLGCGGNNPCVTDKAAMSGIPIYNKDNPVSAPNAKIKGTNTTKPAL